MSLPSYQEAISKPDALVFIAQHVALSDVNTCCRLSKRWNDVFAPILWAEPTKLLFDGSKSLQRYLERYNGFMTRLLMIRSEVRVLVTSMDFRPLQYCRKEMFHDRFHHVSWALHPRHDSGSWFQRLRMLLPSLKIIFLDNFWAFTTQAILLSKAGLQTSELNEKDMPSQPSPLSDVIQRDGVLIDSHQAIDKDLLMSPNIFSPLLLSVHGCYSADPSQLVSTSCFQNLLYLDISMIPQGENRYKLPDLSSLRNLRILKMRDYRLDDKGLDVLLQQLGNRLFSLDLQRNLLTDDAIPLLLGAFLPPLEPQSARVSDLEHTYGIPSRYLEETPNYMERSHASEEQETVQQEWHSHSRPDDPDGIVQYLPGLKERITAGIQNVDTHDNDLMKVTGLTHLYLSDNRFTSDALTTLLKATNRIQVLDFGSAPQTIPRTKQASPLIRPICQTDTIESLSPIISRRIQSLRVHHSIVTHTPTLQTRGEYRLSEQRRIHLTEEEYAKQEIIAAPYIFIPDFNPRVHTLALTDIPRYSFGLVIDRLLQFLHAAADQEASIARAIPVKHQRRAPKMLSGLRILRLEFVRAVNVEAQALGPSVSADVDADEFMNQSLNDFSFFSDDEPAPVLSPVTSERKNSLGDSANKKPLRDVAVEIREYRRKTLGAFEETRQRLGCSSWQVPLGAPHYHWFGSLEVIGL